MSNATSVLKYASVQLAAEALFGLQGRAPGSTFQGAIAPAILEVGNDRSSKFTSPQATEFANEWTVVEHKSNTSTGFSGTLFKSTLTGELVLSFRSTEFLDDAARDNQATNALEIKEKGWAFGQIADMEDWYASLIADPSKLGGSASFTVTGYSLGSVSLGRPGVSQLEDIDA